MNYNGSEIWNEIFGRVWKQLTDSDQGIGGFVAVEKTGEVMLDANAEKLFGFRRTPDYTEFMKNLGRIASHSNFASPIRLHTVDAGEGVTAGFIRIDDKGGEITDVGEIPVLSQPQLIRQMGDDSCMSLIALLKLEGIPSPTYAGMCVISALNAIYGCIPDNGIIASHSKFQYWVYIPDFEGVGENFLDRLQDAVKNCCLTDEFGVTVGEEHTLTFTAGYSVGNGSASQKLHCASFALFEAESKGMGTVCPFSPDRYEIHKNEYQNIRLFSALIDQNLFHYHFQPIVSARTGEIVAYEALMRTDESIGLNPMQILDMAERFDRLYDIEKATIRNTLTYLSSNQELFEKRKLFVNAITAHLLTEEDYKKVCDDFGELLEKVVIELTEQTEVSDDMLITIHNRLQDNSMQLAIDDYGTGYSNTSNLLRYNPDFVKIDRALITNIEKKPKVQKIVAGIIDFLHSSGYIALAEGVETQAELRTLIGYGADLIQGYYVSRPKPVLLREISESVRDDIVRINLETAGEVRKIYRPAENETINICELALEKYNSIFVEVSSVTLVGEKGRTVSMPIAVKDGMNTKITIRNAEIISQTEEPVLRLGLNSNVLLSCEGENTFVLKGIFVPDSSSIEVVGAGTLSVNSEMLSSYAIGCSGDTSHGSITLNMIGNLDLNVQGERCVAIGGGRNDGGNKIRVLNGTVNISCSGGSCVGIGTENGSCIAEIDNCSVSIKSASSSAVGIGSLTGNAEITMKNFASSCDFSGSNLLALGVLSEGSGEISMCDGSMNVVLRGKKLNCIGTLGGEMDCRLANAKIDLYCEGSVVSGIGDKTGAGSVNIKNCSVDMNFLTGDGWGIGSPNGSTEISGGHKNIRINE